MAKKIGAIVSIIVVGILLLTTIIMASVKIDYSVKCANPDTITIQYKQENERAVTTDEKNKIISLISSASKTNSLSALFNGKINKKAELVFDKSNGKTLPTPSEYFVKYIYNIPQQINYKGTTYNSKELVFEVKDQSGEQDLSVYVVLDDSEKYSLHYNLTADFSLLYNYIESIK